MSRPWRVRVDEERGGEVESVKICGRADNSAPTGWCVSAGTTRGGGSRISYRDRPMSQHPPGHPGRPGDAHDPPASDASAGLIVA
jgi:hypothetical protein